ncbi:WD40 repeat domain-containing protein [Dactylosporangium sp. CA-139066]|uniref:WD40 repeat domain-containing protein n=1 Tax=Dactylosporangium sp. CA-139066 TaxID=3239930 RepID=UPI003D8C4534
MRPVPRREHGSAPRRLTVAAGLPRSQLRATDASVLATASKDGVVRLWDLS